MNADGICITTNTLGTGGAEMQRVALANAMAHAGYNVSIFCLQARGILESEVSKSVRVVDWDFRRPIPRGQGPVVISGTTNTEVGFSLLNRKLGRAVGWLAVVHNPVGRGAPPLARFARRGLPQADAVAALTPAHAKTLRDDWKLGVTDILPNGIECSRLLPLRELPRRRDSAKLGYIGRLSRHHKGLDTLLLAFARYAQPRAELSIAGTGPDAEWCRQEICRLRIQDRVKLVGVRRPHQFLAEVDYLFAPSRFEAQPMVLLEALAAGIPVCASKYANADDHPNVTVASDGLRPVDFAPYMQDPTRLQQFDPTTLPLPLNESQMSANYVKTIERLRDGSGRA